MPDKSKDDALTVAALGALAFAIADMVHEVLGYGSAILAVGANPVILTTSYFGDSIAKFRGQPESDELEY